MRYCKECGARLEAAQASCPYCGAAAPARPEERVPEDALPVNARPEERVPETALPEEVPGGAGSPGGTPEEARDAWEDECPVWETAPDDLRTEEPPGARRAEPKLPEGWRPPEKRDWKAAARRRGKSEPVLSVPAYFGTLLLLFVPVAGLIAAVIWAAGGTKRENRRNLARGFLLCCLLAALTGVLVCCGVGALLYRPYWFFGY